MIIIWSPLAVDRAGDIADYIALDNPAAANRWVETLFEKVTVLKFTPKLGRQVPEIGRDDIRELFFGNYRIIYRVGANEISILTVRHGKQLLPVDEVSL